MTEQKKGSLVENVLAPEMFASEAASFALVSRIKIVVSLDSSRWNSELGEFQKVVVGRVVFPISGAQALAVSLNDFLSKHGLDPSSAAKRGLSPQ